MCNHVSFSRKGLPDPLPVNILQQIPIILICEPVPFHRKKTLRISQRDLSLKGGREKKKNGR